MPIAVTCSCGKKLAIPDTLAGKAVQCPGCKQSLRVPAATGAKPQVAKAQVAKAAATKPTEMDNLFEEAGFAVRTGQFCPACSVQMAPGAILCVKCGYHVESGAVMQGHRGNFESEDSTEAILRRADEQMKRAREMDLKMQNTGMPAWMMALILFSLASVTGVAVVAVNVARRGKDSTVSFNASATLFLLIGVAFAAVAIGSGCTVIYRAFKHYPKPNMMRAIWKAGVVFLITLGGAITLFVLAAKSNSGTL